ncbi:MAG: hypothetical protein WD771_07290 [Gemmatimonadaceae bacterium]
MRHFHRTSLHPDAVLATADAFFPTIGMLPAGEGPGARTYRGSVGEPDVASRLDVTVRMEGGHYTFVEAHSDQPGESRLDRNVKKFFVQLHQQVDPTHAFAPSY